MDRLRKIAPKSNPGGPGERGGAPRKSGPSLVAVALFLVSLAFLGLMIFLVLSGP